MIAKVLWPSGQMVIDEYVKLKVKKHQPFFTHDGFRCCITSEGNIMSQVSFKGCLHPFPSFLLDNI